MFEPDPVQIKSPQTNPLENQPRQADPFDLDIKLSAGDLGDNPVDCTSETCNCKTKACQTYSSCSTCSCQCPSRFCSR